MSDLNRRTFMSGLAAATAAAAAEPATAQNQPQQPAKFTYDDVVKRARDLAASPFDGSILKMTLTSVEFVANAGAASGTGFDAKPRWTAIRNSGAKRPCSILTKSANTASPSAGTMPQGIYQAGSVIVADTSYTYVPAFGGTFMNFSTGGITFTHTTYMRPRNTSLISYNPTSVPATSTVCAPY